MARPSAGYPTERELEVLKIIWRDGPCTARQISDALSSGSQQDIRIVLKIMVNMIRKGYLSLERRSKRDGANLYSAKVTKPSIAKGMLQSLARRLFGGSIADAVQSLAREGQMDPKEIAELRRILDGLSSRREK